MTQEEKAKRYDEALEKATALYKAAEPMSGCKVIIEILFPELKESEDERIRRAIVETIHDTPNIELEKNYNISKEEALAWLEKQGEQKPTNNQFTPEQASVLDKHIDKFLEQKPTWSEEDESMLNDIMHNIHFAETHRNVTGSSDMEKDQVNWLKSIKERVRLQSRQEWSEGDKRIIDNLISQLGNLYARKLIKEETKDKYVNWLKSLRPQSQWKPSDEQIKALDIAIRCGIQLGSWEEKVLKSLEEQLKKLREE